MSLRMTYMCMTIVWQERALHEKKRPLAEMIFATNSLGAFMLLVMAARNGELDLLAQRFQTSPSSLLWLLVTVMLAYGGSYAFTACIKGFGAVVATGVGICRKFVSVLASYTIFPKPFNTNHGLGILLFFAGMVLSWTNQAVSKPRRPRRGSKEGATGLVVSREERSNTSTRSSAHKDAASTTTSKAARGVERRGRVEDGKQMCGGEEEKEEEADAGWVAESGACLDEVETSSSCDDGVSQGLDSPLDARGGGEGARVHAAGLASMTSMLHLASLHGTPGTPTTEMSRLMRHAWRSDQVTAEVRKGAWSDRQEEEEGQEVMPILVGAPCAKDESQERFAPRGPER
jgi:hypothetical protein